MRVFVALAFACGALAAAVHPLEAAAAEAHGILSAESDIQDAIFDIDAAPEMAGNVSWQGTLHRKDSAVKDNSSLSNSQYAALPKGPMKRVLKQPKHE
ncbi:hypothetical protein E4U40_006654 [Claviceps sp. LM458 group G5]|nr:hypothetical protein E4U40_006654 [Claviceps sp. LM458 group G5]